MYIVTSKDEYEGDLGEDSIRDAVSCIGVSINVGLIYICIHIYMYIRYNIMCNRIILKCNLINSINICVTLECKNIL